MIDPGTVVSFVAETLFLLTDTRQFCFKPSLGQYSVELFIERPDDILSSQKYTSQR